MTPPARIAPAATPVELEAVARLFRDYAESLSVDLSFQGFGAELASLPGRYEMKRLYVSPRARGLGLGRALVEAVLAAARAAGHREVCLDTLPGMEEAIALYRRSGFRPVAPYYETPVPGTIFLARAL